MGRASEIGWGINKNLNNAFDWYSLAAKQGHTVAQFNLGAMFANGFGV